MFITRSALVLSSALVIGGCGNSSEPEGDTTEGALTAGSVENAIATSCETSSVRKLSQQLVDQIQCMKPGTLTRIDSIPNVTLQPVVFPYLQTPTAKALAKAASHGEITINSALRTLPQQFLLFNWGERHRCGIRVVAHVGHSNHEQGLAIDMGEGSRSAMENAGLHWFGPSDAMHYDYRGGGAADLSGLSTKAFQVLWNLNHPEDKIGEDGNYGGQTEQRLRRTPADGFPKGATCGNAAAANPEAGAPPANAGDAGEN